MKMAKASQADLDMAMDLASMLDTLGHQHCPAMPTVIARNDGDECFDRDDDGQCGRALRALLETADRGSLFRVVWGAVVMLDPRNKLVDPDADTIEHNPETTEAKKDAERYRWLRAQNWNDGLLAVVADPKDAVKLGHDCPSLARLDEQIDAAMLAQRAVRAV